jgi:hypothetical protein
MRKNRREERDEAGWCASILHGPIRGVLNSHRAALLPYNQDFPNGLSGA